MEVGVIKPITDGASGQIPRATTGDKTTEQPTDAVKVPNQNQDPEVKAEAKAEEKKVQPAETKKAVAAVNKFLEYMTADLHFKYNEKVNIMQVQLVSGKDHRVLREYPPKEFLEMVANIREAIGIFLDRKA